MPDADRRQFRGFCRTSAGAIAGVQPPAQGGSILNSADARAALGVNPITQLRVAVVE